jgi:CubicO group peptidase (beta-lactamase class C family)
MCRDWTRKLSSDFPEVGLTWLIRGDDQALQKDRFPGSIDDAHVTTSAAYVFDRRFFGELTSKNAFGHTGATGCAMWADPDLDVAVVLLTNTPQILQSETLPRISNMVAAAAI